jgi:DNA-binding MarR family transcriptional regulator
LPKSDLTLPKSDLTSPKSDLTSPKSDLTSPKSDLTSPKSDLTLPKSKEGVCPSKQRLRLWLSLLRATRYVEAALREELRRAHGSTLPRFDVLSALDRRSEGLTMSQLSQELMVSNGNVTGIVDRLVDDGFVARSPVLDDKRAINIRLTHAGAAKFRAMAAEHERWVDQLLAGIGVDETQYMIDTFHRIREGEK